MELFSSSLKIKNKSTLKNFLYFFSKKSFLIFWEMELSIPKIKKFLIFQEGTFQAQKIKKKTLWKSFSYFRKWKFLAPSLKSSYIFFKKNVFLYSRREIAKSKKQKKSVMKKFLIFSKKNCSPHFEMTANRVVK